MRPTPEAQILNHRTAREIPGDAFIFSCPCSDHGRNICTIKNIMLNVDMALGN